MDRSLSQRNNVRFLPGTATCMKNFLVFVHMKPVVEDIFDSEYVLRLKKDCLDGARLGFGFHCFCQARQSK